MMKTRRVAKGFFTFFGVMTIACVVGLTYVYLDSYYLRSQRNVGNSSDPRWRIFDFNSRQATEGEVYTVSDLPYLEGARLIGDRRLRFSFHLPANPKAWSVVTLKTKGPQSRALRFQDPEEVKKSEPGDPVPVLYRGARAEVEFSGPASDFRYYFFPEGVKLPVGMSLGVAYYPGENYRKAGLSWKDNYHVHDLTMPVSLKRVHSAGEWAGIPPTDPDILEAKEMMGNRIDFKQPALRVSEQVFKFVMDGIRESGGTPADSVQSATPLETYRLLCSGKGKGFCENRALAYYIFANAAGVKTRLIDIAGKLGPLKLTGHYFCESWIPEQGGWAYVDPQAGIANIRTDDGRVFQTLQLKRVVDLDLGWERIISKVYDRGSGELVEKTDHPGLRSIGGSLKGDMVIAYKFGYGNNKSFSKPRNFLRYTTLLIAPFALPRLYLVKFGLLYGLAISTLLCLAGVVGLLLCRRPGKGGPGREGT
jgi:hypothetical protein